MTRYSSSKHIMYSAPPAPEESKTEREATAAEDTTVEADADATPVTADDD